MKTWTVDGAYTFQTVRIWHTKDYRTAAPPKTACTKAVSRTIRIRAVS